MSLPPEVLWNFLERIHHLSVSYNRFDEGFFIDDGRYIYNTNTPRGAEWLELPKNWIVTKWVTIGEVQAESE